MYIFLSKGCLLCVSDSYFLYRNYFSTAWCRCLCPGKLRCSEHKSSHHHCLQVMCLKKNAGQWGATFPPATSIQCFQVYAWEMSVNLLTVRGFQFCNNQNYVSLQKVLLKLLSWFLNRYFKSLDLTLSYIRITPSTSIILK